jgi:hypothetical protein
MHKLQFALLLVTSFCFSQTAPDLTTQLTEDYNLEMPSLKPYVIYMNASVEEPDTIASVTLGIDSDVFTAVEETGFYYFLWTPSDYGPHDIQIIATTNTGGTTTISRTVVVVQNASSINVETLNGVIIEYTGDADSKWHYGTYTLPQSVGVYDSINATLTVECPQINGGCDDWDRLSHIEIKAPNGNWIQIIRYVTPYGIGCNHVTDLTNYNSLLQGEVEFRVFIDTWGSGGWQLSLDLEYNQGTPSYDYSSVTEIWDADYDFGDPSNLQPVETNNIAVPNGIQQSYLSVSTTGHNWGETNTLNAAQFFEATHYLDINNEQAFTQNLWNTCDPNPDNCSDQLGTWRFNRAGGCPGSIARPDIYDLSGYIGSSFDLDYRFHPDYVDLCHPNNSDCDEATISGCYDCDNQFNPYYKVDVHVISKSDEPLIFSVPLGVNSFENSETYDLSIYPNPTNGKFSIQSSVQDAVTKIRVLTIEGKQVKSFHFNTKEELINHDFDLSDLTSGIYFISMKNKYGLGTKKLILK